MRSFLAVLAGFLLWPAICLPFNAFLAASFPQHFGDDGAVSHGGILLASLAISVIASFASGWLTAAVARQSQMAHAGVLAGLNLAIGLFVQISSWHLMPVWYHIPFLILIVPAILVGARRQIRNA